MMTFMQALPSARATPADASGLGTLPTRGYRYCEPLRMASGWGHYIYLPVTLAFEYDGEGELAVWLGDESLGPLEPGEGVQSPEFADAWAQRAPLGLSGRLYPLIARSAHDPAMVQLWTGWLIRTPPEWGVLVRAPVNLPRPVGVTVFEGFIEADRWQGPLFVNVALTKTDRRITLRADWPICQVQAIPRAVLRRPPSVVAVPWSEWTADDWARYAEHVVTPALDPTRPLGDYATRSRQRPDPPGQGDESCESEIA